MRARLEEKQVLTVIKEVKKGDTKAFNLLIQAYQSEVFSLCMRMLKNREDAEEIAQDTFVSAYRKLDTFQATSKFGTWLYRIAYNKCLNKLESNKKFRMDVEWQEEYQTYSSSESSMDELTTKERQQFILLALDQLQEYEAVLLNLYYQNECTLAEMQEILEVPKERLKVQLHRARKRFEIALEGILKGEVKSIL